MKNPFHFLYEKYRLFSPVLSPERQLAVLKILKDFTDRKKMSVGKKAANLPSMRQCLMDFLHLIRSDNKPGSAVEKEFHVVIRKAQRSANLVLALSESNLFNKQVRTILRSDYDYDSLQLAIDYLMDRYFSVKIPVGTEVVPIEVNGILRHYVTTK